MMDATLQSGHWLDHGEADGVVINHRLQQAHPELVPGATLRLRLGTTGRVLDATVVGVIKEFGAPSVYIRDREYRTRVDDTDERVTAAFVRLREPSEHNLAALTALLESHFALAEVRVRGLQSAKLASRVIRGHLDSIVATLLVLALLVLSVSGLGMTSAISTNVVERGRELATLRSIGGTPGTIRRILSSEAVTIAVLGWCGALALSAVISAPLSAYFGEALVEYPFDFRFSWLGVAASLGLAVALSVVASAAPARLAHRRSVNAIMQAGG